MRTLLYSLTAISLSLASMNALASSSYASQSGPYALAGVSVLRPLAHELSNEAAPKLSVGYAFNPQWALELSAPLRAYREEVSVNGFGKVAQFRARPVEASVLYHFATDWADGALVPYVGAGYAWVPTSREHVTNNGAFLGVDDFSLNNAHGPMARVGLDYRLNDTWFARVDATYLDTDARARVNGYRTSRLDGNSWEYSLQVGYQF